ncbi:DsbA family protein [Patulibacter minatonensis]|uniref:DsbA family protein n=1 Tax=Patulibacter minatonensis TaxID=298163 RepID=UPI00047ACBDE|nr:DsbA family protein [Patulibacter minatonensis]
MQPRPVLYVDVGSPFAYLAAERATGVLGRAPELRPILLGGLFRLNGRSSWAGGDPEPRRAGMEDIEARAVRYGLPPMRWPDPWPGNYLVPMLAVQAARLDDPAAGDALLLAGFRRMFVRGEDLGREEVLRAACADADLDADPLLRAATTRPVKNALREATGAAHERGVIGVPTLEVDGRLLWGDDRLEEGAS